MTDTLLTLSQIEDEYGASLWENGEHLKWVVAGKLSDGRIVYRKKRDACTVEHGGEMSLKVACNTYQPQHITIRSGKTIVPPP